MTFNTDSMGEDVLLLKFSPSGAAPDLSGLVHSTCTGGLQN
jgi:hypothetical protein